VLTAQRASVWTMSLLGNLLTVQRLGAQLLLFRMCFVFASGLRPTALRSTASIFTLDRALSNIAACPSPQFTMFYHLGYRLSLVIVTMRIARISRRLNRLCISFATPPRSVPSSRTRCQRVQWMWPSGASRLARQRSGVPGRRVINSPLPSWTPFCEAGVR